MILRCPHHELKKPARPKILQMNGMSMSDFSTQQEALKCADDLIAENEKLFGHSGPDCTIPHKNPLLVRFWYVQGQGKKRTRAQIETKELSGDADVKNKKMLHDAGVFLEGLGPAVEPSSSGKVENAVFAEMSATREKLRIHKTHYTKHILYIKGKIAGLST